MKPKPTQCEKVYLSAHLLPSQFCLLAIGLDENPNALVFDEVNSADLEEFKNVLKLYSGEHRTNIWMYRDLALESELRGCRLKSVQSHSKPDALAIITDSLLRKKKIQIESSLSLRKRLTEFKGQNPFPQVLALFCAVEQLQAKLNGNQVQRTVLVSLSHPTSLENSGWRSPHH